MLSGFFFSLVIERVKRKIVRKRGKLVSRERMARPVTSESKFGNPLFPLKKRCLKKRGLCADRYIGLTLIPSCPRPSIPGMMFLPDIGVNKYMRYTTSIFIDNAIFARAEAFTT